MLRRCAPTVFGETDSSPAISGRDKLVGRYRSTLSSPGLSSSAGGNEHRRPGRRSRPCALLPGGDDVPANRTGKDGPPRRGRLGPHTAAQSLAAVPWAAVPPLAARAR